MIQIFFRLLFYFTLAVIIFLATTTAKIEMVENVWDKANHFAAFFVLYLLLSFSYKKLSIWFKIIVLLAFGVLIETVQYFIPGRYFSFLDVFADSLGIAIGIAAYWIYKKFFRGASS
ncbi:MAG: VanZ family protein [Sulfurimonas sp.]|nr:VanZ family protein [Sulfurimonas sp.]